MCSNTPQSHTKPSVASIPDRAALINERLYTRARLLTLAKQHKISTTQQSRTFIIEALIKKRQLLDAPAKEVNGYRKVTTSSTQSVGSASGQCSSLERFDGLYYTAHSQRNVEAPVRSQGQVEVPVATPIDVSDELRTPVGLLGGHKHTPGLGNKGKSPIGGQFLHRRRRFATALSGLTRSPAVSPANTATKVHLSGEAADMSITPSSLPSRREVRTCGIPSPPPRGTRQFMALEALSEEEEAPEIVSLISDTNPLCPANEPEICSDWSVSGSEKKDGAKGIITSVPSLENGQREEPLWTTTGCLNLNAVPRVVKDGWNWDDITERLRTSDFR